MATMRAFCLAASAALFMSACATPDLPKPMAAPVVVRQQVCVLHEDALERLEKGYGEVPVGMGISNYSALVELLTSPEGSWSILVTAPGGPACLAASGEGWRNVKPKPVGPQT